jgi:hypothetical protein
MYKEITTDEGALTDTQVRPPSGGELGWRRTGGGTASVSGLETTFIFFSCGSEDVGNLLNSLFNVLSHRSVFLGTIISRPSYPLAVLLVEKR